MANWRYSIKVVTRTHPHTCTYTFVHTNAHIHNIRTARSHMHVCMYHSHTSHTYTCKCTHDHKKRKALIISHCRLICTNTCAPNRNIGSAPVHLDKSSLGTSLLCQHNFEHNRSIKHNASIIGIGLTENMIEDQYTLIEHSL